MSTPLNSSLTLDQLGALATFAFVGSITPGPNNTMLMASGANFGLRASTPHLFGVSIGFTVMLVAAGLGLGQVFRSYPFLHNILTVVGATYLLWLAWKISTSRPFVGSASAAPKPQTFRQAAAFQWVNPKAWALALGAATAYAPKTRYGFDFLFIGLIFGAINIPCVAAWTAFGVALRHLLTRRSFLRAFNWSMAALLVASLVPTACVFLHDSVLFANGLAERAL